MPLRRSDTAHHFATSNHFLFKNILVQRIMLSFSILALLLVIVTAFVLGRGTMNVLATGTNANMFKMMIEDTIPIILATSEKEPFQMPPIGEILLGFEPFDPKSILSSQVFAFHTPMGSTATSKEQAAPTPLPIDNEELGRILETTIHPVSAAGYAEADGIYIKNSTTYQINPVELLNQPLNYDKNKNGPKVLITHSHSSESFKPTDANFYKPSDPNRTQDIKYNIVRVGEEMAKVLQQAKIEVIHDTKLHDYPSYSGSYKDSLATVEDYLKKYPSIQVVLDVHRDAMSQGTNTLLKAVTEIDGKKAAQVMIVCGTDLGGLDHPNWRNNLMFAMKLQQSMDQIYPTLSRPIDLRKERFNMHTTNNSLILEVGSNGNTLEEAILGGRAAASALARLLK